MPRHNPKSRDARRDLILALAITSPAIGLLVAIGWAFKWWKIDGYLDHFQTLATGIVAVAAAVVGAYFVQKQINLAREHEEDRIERLFDAARAMLPMTLKGVYRYTDDCAAFLSTARNAPDGSIPPAVPSLDPATITQLRDMVAVSPATVRRQLALLLGELQVQASRIEGLVRRNRWSEAGALTVDQYLTGNAMISAICDRFLPFARWEIDTVDLRVSPDDIRAALRRQAIPIARFARAHEYADVWSRSLGRRTPN